ncbi:hypothetical protein AVEN_114334-1 [Araneus ventricosus]|uniref:Uncharacterized protein n=1 Tax=Araneus ventricosus TaxID=182803 RepID=A0A4Y2HP80_ARAVE|nr:hypothetical protein AVEN_114334-1 [Araneus ventricosus]
MSQFSAAVSTSLFEENLVPDKCLHPSLGTQSGLHWEWLFPLELLQQFLSFASSMGIGMQEDDTITQHVRVFASDGSAMTQSLFLFFEIERTLMWNKVLFKLLKKRGTLTYLALAQWAGE